MRPTCETDKLLSNVYCENDAVVVYEYFVDEVHLGPCEKLPCDTKFEYPMKKAHKKVSHHMCAVKSYSISWFMSILFLKNSEILQVVKFTTMRFIFFKNWYILMSHLFYQDKPLTLSLQACIF